MRRSIVQSLQRVYWARAERASLTTPFVLESSSARLTSSGLERFFATQDSPSEQTSLSTTTIVNKTEIPNDSTPNKPSDVPYPSEPYEEIRQYHRFTDIYLGGLWNRIEKELGKIENAQPDFDYDVQLTSGCMRVKLPDEGEVVICKSPQEQGLKVESNLHLVYGGGSADGADPREEASFTFVEEQGEFISGDSPEGGVPLHQFLEDELSRYLNIELDLEPQPGPHDKVYGPDPT